MGGSLALALLVVPLALGPMACGGASKERAGAATPARAEHNAAARAGSTSSAHVESLAAPAKGDNDGDSPEQTAFDSDDYHSMHFGHAADPTDERAIAAIVKRYYAALASEDASTVCSLLLEVVAEGMPESERGAAGERLPTPGAATAGHRPAPGHTTCASAISGTLAESHRALLAEDRTLRVIGVRVRRRRASALLRFGSTVARHILLYKEGDAWKVGTLADEDLG